jgi:hypothetical protein
MFEQLDIHMHSMKLNPTYFISNIKITSNGSQMKIKNYRILRKNIGVNVHEFELRKGF